MPPARARAPRPPAPDRGTPWAGTAAPAAAESPPRSAKIASWRAEYATISAPSNAVSARIETGSLWLGHGVEHGEKLGEHHRRGAPHTHMYADVEARHVHLVERRSPPRLSFPEHFPAAQ